MACEIATIAGMDGHSVCIACGILLDLMKMPFKALSIVVWAIARR